MKITKITMVLTQLDMKPKDQIHLIRKLEACGIESAKHLGGGYAVRLSDEEIQHLLKLAKAFYRKDML
jgi:hypothetical protein